MISWYVATAYILGRGFKDWMIANSVFGLFDFFRLCHLSCVKRCHGDSRGETPFIKETEGEREMWYLKKGQLNHINYV